MRKVSMSHKANERLLELVTLDVFAKRRSPADAKALSRMFDVLFAQLEDDSVSPATIGIPLRRAFGFLKHPELRIVHHPFRKLDFAVTFRYRKANDECKIESVGLE